MTNPSALPTNVLLLGGVILDRYFEVDRYPEPGGDTLIQRSYDRVGGCCINVSATLKNLGSLPFIVNQYSDDEIGTRIEQYIKVSGYSTEYMRKIPGTTTGYCLTILDPKGERTFFTSKGCEAEFPTDYIAQQITSHFNFAYITGYYLWNRSTAAEVIELVQHLRQSGCQIVFDPGALVTEIDSFQLLALLKLSNWLLPNSTELSNIKTMLDINGDMLSWLSSHQIQGIVVKKGKLGADVYSASDQFSVNGYPVNVIDTTGSGDSFAGGFIFGLANGYSLREAIALANACGALTATYKGPHGNFSLDDALHLIKDNAS